MRDDVGVIVFVVIAVGIIAAEMIFSYVAISGKDNELAQAKLSLSQTKSVVDGYKSKIQELTFQLSSLQSELASAKVQFQQVNDEYQKSKNQVPAAKVAEPPVQMKLPDKEKVIQSEKDIKSDINNNLPAYCSDEPAKRKCSHYNIQILMGAKYICPDNYTIMDGYPPGGVKGPVCEMNSGSDGTPATCKDFNSPGCNPSSTNIPCYGKWPCSKYLCYNYYNQWYVVQAMPAEEVCGK